MERINKSSGVNESERYLSNVAEKTFLSLWSYPNLYKQVGTELADLLVVHGKDIIIFSDKNIGWSNNVETNVAWKRWYSKAIKSGADSVSGAAKWIKEQPGRLFMDAPNKEKVPFSLPPVNDLRFHLVCVCSGVETVIKKYYGDRSGTFMLSAKVRGDDHVAKCGTEGFPFFTIGDILPEKDFVHVFSRSALDFVMTESDTISDFINYLDWRKEGIRGDRLTFAAGEEELVALYWGQMNQVGWDLTKLYGPGALGRGLIAVGGLHREMCLSPAYLEWKLACAESKFWDAMIQEFAKHVISGKVPVVAGHIPSFVSSEGVLRYMASETRERRIILSRAFKGMMQRSIEDKADRYVRKFPLMSMKDTHGYVFMVSTYHSDVHGDYLSFRDERAEIISLYCLDLLHSFPSLGHAIGITLDTSPLVSGKFGSSSDILVVERPDFDDDFIKYLDTMRAELEMKPIDVKSVSKTIKSMDRDRKLRRPKGTVPRKRIFRP